MRSAADLLRAALSRPVVLLCCKPHWCKLPGLSNMWLQGRLVEDSDCEDHAQLDADFDQSQQQQQQPTTPQPMEVDLLVQPPSDVAAVTTVSSAVKSIAPVADKENANQLQHAGASGKPSKQRRPFGKILSDVNTNVPAVLAPNSALEPPVKQAGVAAAVAASQAAAASAAALDSGDLAAVEAAAAAEAVGHWPQEDAAMYKLRAVVRHKGPLASSGHFVSDVKSNLQVGWLVWEDYYFCHMKLAVGEVRSRGGRTLFCDHCSGSNSTHVL